MNKVFISVFLFFISVTSYSQNTITGYFNGIANQQIKLVGFQGFNTYVIDSIITNEKGFFSLSFNKKDYGVAFLVSEENKPFVVIIQSENIKLEGESFANPQSIKIIESNENKLFVQYASEHPRREQSLSAWAYLEKIYTKDSLFSIQNTPKQAIINEKKRIKAEDSLFLINLTPDTYVSWYLPLRKLISSVSTIAQYRTNEIPKTISAFRKLNYADNRLYKSGLLKELIESHFWLIENSGRSLDSVYIEMNISIDYIIENLKLDEYKLNIVTEYLFKLLEKRSLFNSSEYLALELLNDKSCIINNDFASQLESYRAMKIGNTAYDIEFKGDIYSFKYSVNQLPTKLSNITTKYTVLVFGASWCNKCVENISEIANLYEKWKSNGVELIFISLDDNKQDFNNFVINLPFISYCDYKKWESYIVQKFHIFATPTMYLLDDNLKIILKPNSIKQLDAWIDWYLIKNK